MLATGNLRNGARDGGQPPWNAQEAAKLADAVGVIVTLGRTMEHTCKESTAARHQLPEAPSNRETNVAKLVSCGGRHHVPRVHIPG